MDYIEDEKELRKIIVRNIYDSRIDEELLYELFLQAGPINSLIMPIGHNGRPNLAIIEYTHESAVPYALFIFEGTELYGCRLNLSSANRTPPTFYTNSNQISNNINSPFINQGPPLINNDSFMMNPQIMNVQAPLISNEPNFEQLLKFGQNMFMPGMIDNPYNMNQISMPIRESRDNYQRDNHRNNYRDDYRNYSRNRSGHRSRSPDHRNNRYHRR